MFDRPSPAMVVALLALFIALGGVGYAANGGSFILGAINTATLRTMLRSNVAGAGLHSTNLSTGVGATALSLNVTTGKPPLIVNSSVKVRDLNADQLDGYSANQLGRVAYKETHNSSWLEDGRSALLSVTLSVPQNGFVTLSGGAGAAYLGGCTYCAVHIRFRIDSATDTSARGTVITRPGIEQHGPLSHIVTVPISQGTHIFELIGSWFDVNETNVAPSAWYDPTLTAHFIPFNGNGTTTPALTPRSTQRTLASPSAVHRFRH